MVFRLRRDKNEPDKEQRQDKRISELETKIFKLQWSLDNPPKYKNGDKIKFELHEKRSLLTKL